MTRFRCLNFFTCPNGFTGRTADDSLLKKRDTVLLRLFVMSIGHLSIYNGIKGFGKHLHRIAVKNGQVCILAWFNGSNPIRYAADFCRVAGNGLQRMLYTKPFFCSEPGAIGKYWMRVT